MKTKQRKIKPGAFIILMLTASPLVAAPFSDNGDGTVTDKATGLIWQKCSMGQNNDSSCTGSATTANWTTALSYCNNLTLAGKTWRLPNVNELKSIVDRTTDNPAIDTTAFPDTVAGNYWSASTYVLTTTTAWRVYFVSGVVVSGNKPLSYYVRCVAGP